MRGREETKTRIFGNIFAFYVRYEYEFVCGITK